MQTRIKLPKSTKLFKRLEKLHAKLTAAIDANPDIDQDSRDTFNFLLKSAKILNHPFKPYCLIMDTLSDLDTSDKKFDTIIYLVTTMTGLAGELKGILDANNQNNLDLE